jgi:hypothetical protein
MRPTPRQSRWSPLWPVLRVVARHRLPWPSRAARRRSPTGVPTDRAALPLPPPLSNRLPPSPGGRPWSSEYAVATIPVAPVRSIAVSFARSRRCSHRRRVIALAPELTSWFSGLSMAGFEVTLYGRIWVTPEGKRCYPGRGSRIDRDALPQAPREIVVASKPRLGGQSRSGGEFAVFPVP